MPLQNRVSPFGELFADAGRGTMFGNRGGRIHNDDRTLGTRRWVTRAWICCRLEFKGRQRDVWSSGYTELFFLDEVTALAAGHRPCFECRRHDAQAFAAAFAKGHRLKTVLRAADMDEVLHPERLDGRAKRIHRLPVDDLPDGTMIVLAKAPDLAFAVRGRSLLRWTSAGYASRRARPRGVTVDALTPPATIAALASGFSPGWHPSAGSSY